MEQELTNSGTTTPLIEKRMNGYIDETGVLFATTDEIVESYHNDEMDIYHFIIHSYAGDLINVGLTKRQVEEMNLFVRREIAQQNYFKHINNK